MTYQSLHTLYGLQRMAAAEATGVPINLVEMAVGDGNGNPTTPAEDQSVLVREMYRATVNRVFQDPDNPVMFTVELLIPASVGGFTIREAAIFDDAGGMFVVANIPNAYKPTDTEGAYADTVVRLQFAVSNATVVTLLVDPNVVLATHTWIINNITPAILIPGGNTNQLLSKNSNADGDFKWVDLDGINVTVDCIEETQTLAVTQTVVNLSVTTTRGLAVYIEGVRLRSDEWTPDTLLNTRLALAQSYPDGTKLVAAQNDPHGVSPDPLLKNQNLADVLDVPLARTNLGVDSKANTDTHAPVSEIGYFPRNTAPSGWMKANGAQVSRTAYAALFAIIGTMFGVGDGFNTFNLPDLRGEFLRGWDDAKGADPGRQLGGWQASQNLLHNHGVNDPSHSHTQTRDDSIGAAQGVNNPDAVPGNQPWGQTTASQTGISIQTSGGNEARPRNVAMLACIKY